MPAKFSVTVVFAFNDAPTLSEGELLGSMHGPVVSWGRPQCHEDLDLSFRDTVDFCFIQRDTTSRAISYRSG